MEKEINQCVECNLPAIEGRSYCIEHAARIDMDDDIMRDNAIIDQEFIDEAGEE